MKKKHQRIRDLPNIENCTFFIEYERAPLPETYVLLEDYKQLDYIMLKNCRVIPDPDEDVDGFHVFIKHTRLSRTTAAKKSELFRKLRYEAQTEMVREALQTGKLKWTHMGFEGEKSIKVWCWQVIEEIEQNL